MVSAKNTIAVDPVWGRIQFALLMFFTMILTACGGGGGGSSAPAVATLKSITIAPASPSIAAGLSQQLTATGNYSDGTSQVLTSGVSWSSSDSSATVDSHGLLKTSKAGTPIITASSNGISGTTQVNVTAAVLQSVTVTAASANVAAGLTVQFTATGNYSDGTSQAILTPNWSSSSTGIATIDATGLAKTLKAGVTTISATFGGITGTNDLTVSAAVLQTISLTAKSNSVPAGLTQQYTATGNYSDGTSQVINTASWSFSDTTVATVDQTGLIKALKAGTGVLTVTYGGVSGTANVIVTAAVLQSIAIAPPNPSVAAGLTQQLTATGSYSDGSKQVLSTPVWSSSNITFATVSSSGLVQSLKSGNVTISATFNGITGTVPLQVTAAVLQSIAIQPASASVPAGLTQTFVAMGSYSDGSSFAVSPAVWSSSDITVATVQSNGTIKSLKTGQVTITATYNGLTATASLTVTPAILQSVQVAAVANNPGDITQQFNATAVYSDGTTQSVTADQWSSSDNTVATVNASGLAQYLKQGATSITASYQGVTGSATLSITAPVLKSITVTPQSTSILAGWAMPVTASEQYSDGSTQTVNVFWSSSDTSIANVIAGGAIVNGVPQGNTGATFSGNKAGIVQVIATVHGVTGSATVTVTKNLTITPNPITSILVGQALQLQFNYTQQPLLGNPVTPTWTSSDPTIATVSSTGLVTAIKPGAVQISASVGSQIDTFQLTVSQVPLPNVPLCLGALAFC